MKKLRASQDELSKYLMRGYINLFNIAPPSFKFLFHYAPKEKETTPCETASLLDALGVIKAILQSIPS